MAEVRVKTISYKPGEKPENSSGFDPLYGGEGENIIPFPRDRIIPWWKDDDEAKLSIDPEDYPEVDSLSIEELIKQVKKKVLETTGINLELEIKIIGSN